MAGLPAIRGMAAPTELGKRVWRLWLRISCSSGFQAGSALASFSASHTLPPQQIFANLRGRKQKPATGTSCQAAD